MKNSRSISEKASVKQTKKVVRHFLVVGPQDSYIYEAMVVRNSDGRATDDDDHIKRQFMLHSSLDLLEEALWSPTIANRLTNFLTSESLSPLGVPEGSNSSSPGITNSALPFFASTTPNPTGFFFPLTRVGVNSTNSSIGIFRQGVSSSVRSQNSKSLVDKGNTGGSFFPCLDRQENEMVISAYVGWSSYRLLLLQNSEPDENLLLSFFIEAHRWCVRFLMNPFTHPCDPISQGFIKDQLNQLFETFNS